MISNLNYVRYLKAKESVDDRSVNSYVYSTFTEHLLTYVNGGNQVRILDVGAGLGSSFKRIVKSIKHVHIDYTFIDIEEAHVTTARSEVAQWLSDHGHPIDQGRAGSLRVKTDSRVVTCHFVTADALTFAADAAEAFDALVGQAFLDIIPLESGLTALFTALKPGGVFYFPINFDGISALIPTIDQARDARVEEIFHRSMDDRNGGRTGGSHTGRQLLDVLPAVGARIEAVGASDWIVRPTADANRYPDDEKYFLQCILKFMRKELLASGPLSAVDVAEWYNQRSAQLDTYELNYIAHQLDYTGLYLGT